MSPSKTRTHLLRRALSVGALALGISAVVAAPAVANPLAPDPAHSPNAEDIRIAYWVTLIVAAILAVAFLGALLTAVRRFRERRGASPRRVTAGRRVTLRVAGALGVVAAALFVVGVLVTESARKIEPSGPEGLNAATARHAQVGVTGVPEPAPGSDEQPEGAPLEINAVGQQWMWRFEYPGEREDIAEVFSYNELVVPVDTAVLLNVRTVDVMHRWFVPALGGQVDAVPGTTTQTWFKADQVGRYPGASTMYSGTSFPAMRIWVRVVTPEEYEQYIEQRAADLTEAQGAVEEANREAEDSTE
ncbi:MAG TPA: cytochrome c oxidase subunit II [Solirubrobacterales bacterium]